MVPGPRTGYSTYKWTRQHSHAKQHHTAKPCSLSWLKEAVSGRTLCTLKCAHTEYWWRPPVPPVITPVNDEHNTPAHPDVRLLCGSSAPMQVFSPWVRCFCVVSGDHRTTSLLVSTIESLYGEVSPQAHDQPMVTSWHTFPAGSSIILPLVTDASVHVTAHKAVCIVFSSRPGQGLDISISHTYSTF